MTNHPRQNWMNHCNNTWPRYFQVWLRHIRPRSQSYTSGQKKFVSVLCCFWLHIDLFTHSVDMFGSSPFKSFVQSFDTWYIDKKACRPLYRIHSQHKPPGTIHPPILHIGILNSLRNRSRAKSTTSTTTGYQFPSGIGTPAAGLTPPPSPPHKAPPIAIGAN